MKYDFSDHLKLVLKKLSRKDPESYKAVLKKIEEVVTSGNLEHYKPLRYAMKNQRRVHIRGSFVLVFEYDTPTDTTSLLSFGKLYK